MKSITVTKLGGTSGLTIIDQPDIQPAADEVTIKVAYVGVGGIDAIMRRGDLGEMNPQPPFVPGLEVSGTIAAVGSDVSGLKVGDNVAALLLLQMGGYATIVNCKATNVVRVPDGIDLSSACMLVNPVTALTVLRLIEPRDEGSFVIHGASGGLGASFGPVAHAAYPSVRTIATVRNESKIKAVEHVGFTEVITTAQFAQRVKSGERYDAVIDPVGGDLRRTSLTALKPFGSILLVGNVSGDTESMVNSQHIWLNSFTVRGFNLGLFNTMYPERVQQTAYDVLALIKQGDLMLTPHEIFSFEDVAKAHEYIESGAVIGQIALKV